jgi:hypothetical protein
VSRDRREYRLTLYPSRDRTEWRLVRVDWHLGVPSFTRIEAGSLPLSIRGGRGYLLDIWRVIRELERRWKRTVAAEPPREPLGGGGGDVPLPGMEHLADVISFPGQPLDTPEDER